MVLLQEVDGMIGNCIREIVRFLVNISLPDCFIVIKLVRMSLRMCNPVTKPLLWVMLSPRCPLAAKPTIIASIGKYTRQVSKLPNCAVSIWPHLKIRLLPTQIGVDAMLRRNQAGEKSCPARRTDWVHTIGVGEPNPSIR